MAHVRFLPWLRLGIGALLTERDPGDGQPLPTSRGTLATTVAVGGTGTGTAQVNLRVLGPPDVTGIDVRQVIRTEPAPFSTDLEPNYLPAVEFDRPDFPWLFTPAVAGDGDQLRPWIVLVVVERHAVDLVQPPDRLAVADIADAAGQLPDLAQSWAWAHAQFAGTTDPATADPSQSLSRLVCPRRLAPDTAYLAIVVPAFEAGRLAGLGTGGAPPPSTDPLLPAWTATTTAVDLPVYHHWEFRTGAAGDFESLAGRLRRVRLDPAQVGSADLHVADLPAGMPAVGGPLVLRGALTVAGGAAGDPQPSAAFRAALETLVNSQPPGTRPPGLPLPPPLYGRWPAAVSSVPAAGWLRELNVTPGLRAAAGLGARIVMEQQEQLAAAAWAQAEELVRVNQLLRQSQLARQVGGSAYAAVVRPADDAQLILLAGPGLGRIMRGDRTVAARLAGSRVPGAMTRPAFRRVARSRGRAGRSGADPNRILTRVDEGTLPVVPTPPRPAGIVTPDDLVDTALCTVTDPFLRQLGEPANPEMRVFYRAALRQQRTMPLCDPHRPPGLPPLGIAATATAIRAALDPEDTVPARVTARVTRPAGWAPADPLEPVMAAPRFRTPMWRSLVAVSPDLLLPGVSDVPPNAVTAAVSNPRFIEAFMVGLNHEMSRELLWRGFPTDQRGTYFRRFWDPAARIPPLPEQDRDDVPPIDGWRPLTGDLGSHVRSEQFVLLIRGDVLRRYPRTAVYLARGEWYDHQPSGSRRRRPVTPSTAPGTAGYPEVYPMFSGTLAPDITFLGFPASPGRADIVGDSDPSANAPGWFVVLQQQPTELRFGLDEDAPDPAGATGTWRDLSWVHVGLSGSGHIDLGAALTGDPVSQPGGLSWGTSSTSAQLAAILTQQPVRVAIHGSDLIVAGAA